MMSYKKILISLFLTLLLVVDTSLYSSLSYNSNRSIYNHVSDNHSEHKIYSSVTSPRYDYNCSYSHRRIGQFDPIVQYYLNQQNQLPKEQNNSSQATHQTTSSQRQSFNYCNPVACIQLYNEGIKEGVAKNNRCVEENSRQISQKIADQLPSLKKFSDCYSDNTTHERYQNRHKAIIEITEQAHYSDKYYRLNDSSKDLLEKHSLSDYAYFVLCRGNQLQQVIHAECVSILNELGEQINQTHMSNSLREVVDATVNYTTITANFNENAEFPQALKCADVAWSLLEYTHALATGIGKGAVNIATGLYTTITHPVETVKTIARAAGCVAVELADFVLACSEMSLYAHLEDADKMNETADKLMQKVSLITDYLDKEFLQLSSTKKVEKVATLATEFLLPGRVLKIMHNSSMLARLQASTVAQLGKTVNKVQTLIEAPLAVAYAKTHDMLCLAQKYGQQNLQKALDIFKANKAGFIEISGSPKKALKGIVKATNREIVLSEMTTLEELIDAIGKFERVNNAKQAFLYGLNHMEIIEHFAKCYKEKIILDKFNNPCFKNDLVRLGYHQSTLGNKIPTLDVLSKGKDYKLRLLE